MALALARDWNQGGGSTQPQGQKPRLRDILNAFVGGSLADLKALNADERVGFGRFYRADFGAYLWKPLSVLTGDDQLIVTPTDAPAAGRWCLVPGIYDLALPFTFATANNAVLYTFPTGAVANLLGLDWEIIASMTGGTTPAVGVSSAKTGFSTAGDLLGGASGDLTATLVAGRTAGTVGAKMDTLAKRDAAIFVGADNLRWNAIASAFTAGSGNVHVKTHVRANPGA